MLKFVLDRLPIGQHIPCEVLGELWGAKATFRKRVSVDVMANLLAQFGVYVSTVNGRGKVKGIVPGEHTGAAGVGAGARTLLTLKWMTPKKTHPAAPSAAAHLRGILM